MYGCFPFATLRLLLSPRCQSARPEDSGRASAEPHSRQTKLSYLAKLMRTVESPKTSR